MVSAILTIPGGCRHLGKKISPYYGVGGSQEKVKLREYVGILKANKELQRLIVAGSRCKLAFSIATNMTVLCML